MSGHRINHLRFHWLPVSDDLFPTPITHLHFISGARDFEEVWGSGGRVGRGVIRLLWGGLRLSWLQWRWWGRPNPGQLQIIPPVVDLIVLLTQLSHTFTSGIVRRSYYLTNPLLEVISALINVLKIALPRYEVFSCHDVRSTNLDVGNTITMTLYILIPWYERYFYHDVTCLVLTAYQDVVNFPKMWVSLLPRGSSITIFYHDLRITLTVI